MFRYTLPFLCHVYALTANPLNWSVPATIPAVPTVTVSSNAVFGAYDISTQQLVALWSVSGTGGIFPYFSTYTPSSGWLNPVTFGNGVTQPFNDLFPLYLPSAPNAGQIITGFSDEANGVLFGAPTTYNYNGTWNSLPQVISESSGTTGDVFLAFSSNNTSLYAAWTDYNTTYPTFASYDFNTNSWVSLSSIPSSPTSNSDTSIVCDGQGNLFAAWTSTSNVPTYAIYNGGSWSNPNPITSTSSSQSRVFLTYNVQTNQVFAAWNDLTRVFNYAIYENGAWNPSVSVSGTDVEEDVYLTYNSNLGQVFASWADKASGGNPSYGIYNPGTQSWQIAPISTSVKAAPVVTLVYAPTLNTMFALWKDAQSSYPYWSSLYQVLLPNPIPSLSGKKMKNDFGTISELYTILRWLPSSTTPILGYHVYRDGILIATLDPSILKYEVHNLTNQPVIFSVTAFNSNGDSSPVSITLY